jgi:glutathionylspermidine synthase
MKRILSIPRPDWKNKVEAVGLAWHSSKGDYWNEQAYYSFTMDEVLRIERATAEMHARCLEAVEHVITNRLYSKLHIPESAIHQIEATWEQEPPSLYGRFDFAYTGIGEPRMLEYNADTPTSLVEASVVQWDWLQELHPNNDQFNSIHEKLIACWADFAQYLKGDVLHFASMEDIEDEMTVHYLRDVAEQAGLKTKFIHINKIGLTTDGFFTDEDDEVISSCFKLYPWEWMVHEGYAQTLAEIGTDMMWIEPAWKQILSNKGILPILSDLFPDHPNILKASFDKSDTILMDAFVEKPLLSREGAGVSVTMFDQEVVKTDSQGYGEEGFVYQEMAGIPEIDGRYPIIGSWIIGQEPAGMGIRESKHYVSDNLSMFAPHLIEG